MSQVKKRKGGAERLRDKRKKLLIESGEKCAKLETLFKKQSDQEATTSTSKTSTKEAGVDVGPSAKVDKPLPSPNENIVELVELEYQVDHEIVEVRSEIGESKLESTLTSDPLNFFIRPKENELSTFFKKHPFQPSSEDSNLPFKSKKIFYRENGIQRIWLTFDAISTKLYCSVCLAFSNHLERNSFCEGNKDWKHIYQRIKEHETSKCHEMSSESYFTVFSNKDVKSLLFIGQKKIRIEQVKAKRQVLERVVNVIKLIGKRGLSFRAKKYEAAYTLNDSSLDHGNFLEIILLLSKYDVVLKEHIMTVSSLSQKLHEKSLQSDKSRSGRGNLLTFLSKSTVSLVMQAISAEIKKIISNEIKEAGMFSVQLDTTQDISVKDQCSVVLRYVYGGEVKECLIGLESCTDSTGEGFLNLLKNVLNKNGLDITHCIGNATDGAANMGGQYNGFTAWLTESSPGQIHIWCYSHILNLVLQDTTKCIIAAASLFSNINSLAVFFKESYQRMDVWRQISTDNERYKKLQSIGETRWWAKHKALQQIFGTYQLHEGALYVDVVIALLEIEESQKFSSDVRAKARNLKASLLKYETILISQIYLKIFSITNPLSKYLQTSGMDLLKSHQMVTSALVDLRAIQRGAAIMKPAADSFVKWANEQFERRNVDEEVEEDLPRKRVRRVKKMPGESAEDTSLPDPFQKFTVDTYNVILDQVIQSMERRFEENGKLYVDLSLLSPTNFDEIKRGKLSSEALHALTEKLTKFTPDITKESLFEELTAFAKNWDRLKMSINEEYTYLKPVYEEEEIIELDEEENMPPDPHCKCCKNCALCCYLVLMKYNLYSEAYKNLTVAYKFLLTLPTTQVACERSFSLLKFIKNRLRSTISDSNLEAFLLMACEKKILNELDNDTIIDKIAEHSSLLRKELSTQI